MLLPLVLVQTVTSFTAGVLVSKTGNYQLNLWVGFAIWTIALGLLSTISPTISNAKLVGYQILNGIGAGQTFQTSLIAIQASVKRSEMAVATATRNFLRLLGGTIALAACAAILNNTTTYVDRFLKMTLTGRILEHGKADITFRYRNDLAGVVSGDIIDQIISDPTVIVSGGLGLTTDETSAALKAYSTFSHKLRPILTMYLTHFLHSERYPQYLLLHDSIIRNFLLCDAFHDQGAYFETG